MGRLDGIRILVTGAGRGIGKAYAKTLAGEGARVALADILDAGPAAEEIAGAGGDGRAFHVDVSDEASVGK
nr:SDR family NAD(P)-dependent oxidoreductase [Nitrospinota bacterium]